MYMAREYHRGRRRYFLRESYRDAATGRLLSRDLMDLGANPARFIVYPGGRAYYVHESVEERLRAMDATYSPEALDDLFFPFLDPEIRWKLEWIERRRCRKKNAGTGTSAIAQTDPHLFDKRRVHFLRYGSMDQRRIGGMSSKMLRVLDGKSRDEIEQYFIAMEDGLRAREIKTYVFVIFDLQRFFTESWARCAPQILSQEKLDACFLEAICQLNADRSFWAGVPADAGLHAYLVRYAIMYFDFDYGQGRFVDDMLRHFINSRRRYVPPKSVQVKMAEAAVLFGTETEKLRKMKRAELTRLFRRRAQKLHPDKGGDHDRFCKLTAAYRALCRRKPG